MESLRHQNRRASNKLNDALYSKQGVFANHKHEMKEVTKDKKHLERELQKIQKTGCTTRGQLPPRESTSQENLGSETPSRSDRNSVVSMKERLVDERRATDEKVKSFNESLSQKSSTLPTVSDAQPRGGAKDHMRKSLPEVTSIADADYGVAKEKVEQRLLLEETRRKGTASDVSTELQKRLSQAGRVRKESSSRDDDDLNFDGTLYNPDGSLRTVHMLPDFKAAFREAKKARYVRTRGKQWFEKELSIKDIFDKNLKEKTLVLYSSFD